MLNLPAGGSTSVEFDYERVQKRCYGCQRLTHEKEICPFLLKKRQVLEGITGPVVVVESVVKPLQIKSSGPLFGVLTEEQVGVNPLTGRIKIARIVLERMRQYLMVADGDERSLRIDKVKRTVGIAEKDPVARKAVLSLEPAPILSKNVNKAKGRVFDYESTDSTNWSKTELEGKKLMDESLKTMSCPMEVLPSQISQFFKILGLQSCSQGLLFLIRRSTGLASPRLVLPGLNLKKENRDDILQSESGSLSLGIQI